MFGQKCGRIVIFPFFPIAKKVFGEVNGFNFGSDNSRPPQDLDLEFVPEPKSKGCLIM